VTDSPAAAVLAADRIGATRASAGPSADCKGKAPRCGPPACAERAAGDEACARKPAAPFPGGICVGAQLMAGARPRVPGHAGVRLDRGRRQGPSSPATPALQDPRIWAGNTLRIVRGQCPTRWLAGPSRPGTGGPARLFRALRSTFVVARSQHADSGYKLRWNRCTAMVGIDQHRGHPSSTRRRAKR